MVPDPAVVVRDRWESPGRVRVLAKLARRDTRRGGRLLNAAGDAEAEAVRGKWSRDGRVTLSCFGRYKNVIETYQDLRRHGRRRRWVAAPCFSSTSPSTGRSA